MLLTETTTAPNARELKAAVVSVLYRFKQCYPKIEVKADTAEAWCGLLCDLPPDAILQGGQTVLLNSQYPTLPGVGELRAAAERAAGLVPSAVEAFALARYHLKTNPMGYVCGIDLSDVELSDSAKALIEETAKRFKYADLEYANSDAERRRFERLYEQVCDGFRATRIEASRAQLNGALAFDATQSPALTSPTAGEGASDATSQSERSSELPDG